METRVYLSEDGTSRAVVTNPRTGHRELVAPQATKEALKTEIAAAIDRLYAKEASLLPS